MEQNYPNLVEWMEQMNDIRHELAVGGELTDAYDIVCEEIENDPTVDIFLLHPEIRQEIPDGVHSNQPLPPGLLSIERLATNYNPLLDAHKDLNLLMTIILQENTPERDQLHQAAAAANGGNVEAQNLLEAFEQMIHNEGWFVDTLQVLNNALIIAGTQWVQLLDARNIDDPLQRQNRIIQILQEWNPDESQFPIHWYPPGYIGHDHWNQDPFFADINWWLKYTILILSHLFRYVV